MSLRWKIILLLAAVFGLYLTATRAIQESVMMPSFAALEREQAIDDIDRCVGAIKSEIRHLSMFCGDWSSWDDAYAFAEGRDAEFIKRNMMPSTFSTNQLSLICITAPDGRVLWQQGYNVPSMHPIAISPFSAGRLPETHPLVHHPDIRSQVGGVILTDRGPMLVVSRPILTSNEVGPIRGAMIMGRLLTEKHL